MSSRASPTPSDASGRPVATGFDLEPLPNGDVLIRFSAGGEIVNSQVVTRTNLAQLPAVVHALLLIVDEGSEAAIEFFNRLTAGSGHPHGGGGGTTDVRSGGDQ